jgi:hypothetical protein
MNTVSFDRNLPLVIITVSIKMKSAVYDFHFAIDTGASVSLIDLDVLNAIGFNKSNCVNTIKTMTASQQETAYEFEIPNLKAIDIMSEYEKNGFDYDIDIDLEIAGILLQYRSILVNSDWLDLHEKKKYNEVSDKDFYNKKEKLTERCKSIHDRQGVLFFNNVSKRKLTEMSGGARQNIIAGLYAYIDIIIKLKRYNKEITEICQYIYYCAPNNFHEQFKRKENKLTKISLHSSSNEKTHTKSISDFGVQLQNALKKP